MPLSEILKCYLEEHNMSQRQFAKRCGVSNGYISMIINNSNPTTGKPLVPSLKSLLSIAYGMNLTFEELVAQADDIKCDISIEGNRSSIGTLLGRSDTTPETEDEQILRLFDTTDENIVLLSRKNGNRKKYTLSDAQTNIVENLLSEFSSADTSRPASQIAYGGKENKSTRKKKKTTI